MSEPVDDARPGEAWTGTAFKYRFVSFGTTFSAVPGMRGPDDERNPASLFENEIAVNVGKANWSGKPGEAVVIDHHYRSEGQFPSSSVAVLHHAVLLRERFGDAKHDVIWLVTHKPPNFDCYTAMYLARWLIEDPVATAGFDASGLTFDGFADDEKPYRSGVVTKRFNWFRPHLERFPEHARWAVLLASFASHADHAARIPCPRTRALHSILFAALIRGRPYESRDSGAHEFFDAVRGAMQPAGGSSKGALNPLYDSILDGSEEFAPELSLLDGEAEAYERDIARARKTVVFLPALDCAFADAYGAAVQKPLLADERTVDLVHQHFGGVRRVPADGLYLRDPECILLQEWARLDLDNSSRREGFTFTMIARSGRRPGCVNETEYFIALDPESARNCHLYPVWARLEAAEVAAWRLPQNEERRAALPSQARPGYELRAGSEPELFSDPWYDGERYDCRIIATPGAGTLLRPGVRRDLEDDEVASIVQDSLQLLVYTSSFEFVDVAAVATHSELDIRDQVNSAKDTPRHVAAGRSRFGKVMLSDVVDLRSDVFTDQTARVLWAMLHPDELDGPPAELVDECCVREGGMLGVWSTSGVMIAYRRAAKDQVEALWAVFADLADVARRVDALIATTDPQADDRLQHEIVEGRELTHRMIKIRQGFGLPGGRIIERFADRSGRFETIGMLRDARISEAARASLAVSRETHDLTVQLTGAMVTVAGVQLKLEWLELIFVGIYSTELANIIAEHVIPRNLRLFSTLLIALVLTVIAAGYLRPWEGHRGKKALPMMYAFLAVILGGMFFGGLIAAGKIVHEPLPVVVEPAAASHEPAAAGHETPPRKRAALPAVKAPRRP